ncbi:MAG: hypothetical protein LIO93_01100 [Bacteroidales bacterium]|nr:hypothetical protein [Bacteroidales bacterium]
MEEVNVSNNSIRNSIFVAGNLADLTIIGHNIPSVVSSGVEWDLEWTVLNQGNRPAAYFTDVVYISNVPRINESSERLKTILVTEVAEGKSYTQKVKLTVPDKWNGSRYLILHTNYGDQEVELDENNNRIVVPLTVSLSPLPDLQVKEVVLGGECVSGQPLKIIYEVINNGASPTRQNKWSDEFYLSEGTTLNKNRDLRLGVKIHVGLLGIGESYTDSIEVNIPSHLSGNYTLFTYTDSGNAIYESGSEENNISSLAVNVLRPLPSDLIVEEVVAPVRIIAGETIDISYVIRNNGAFSASGILKDAIYVSADTQWDAEDIMIGKTSGPVSLDPGGTVSRTATGKITNVPVGEYFIIIRTNLTNSIIESTLDNNYGNTTTPSRIDFEELNLGGSHTVGNSSYFKLEAQGSMVGETLAVYLESEDENIPAGLYVSHQEVPTVAQYDYHSARFQQREQEVLVPAMEEGIYYIYSKNNSARTTDNNSFSLTGAAAPAPEASFNLSSKILQFEITNIRTNQGGNGGSVTSDVTGAKFDTIMDFRLKNSEGYIPAEAVYFQDQTYSVVSFNLNNTSPGTYDIVAELPGGKLTELENAYTVVNGVSIPLSTKIVMPSSACLSTKVPFSIEYSNMGTTDIAVSGLLLVSANGHPIGLSIKDLEKRETEIHIPLYQEEDRAKPSVMSPGSKGTRTVFVYADTAQTISLRLYIIRRDY